MIEEDERRGRGELVTTLLSQRRGLLADAESVLGNAPGDDVVAQLRALGRLPTSGVDDLIAALRTVDVEANATTAVHQANAWLADVAAAHEIAAKCDQEASTLDQRDTEIATAAAEIERTRVEIADSLASTHTETELITAELTARAGGDQERLGRVAEAQRLCDQVEAVRAALEEAEAVARNELDAAIGASSSADDLCDRNARLLAMAGQRAQELAASLSADLRPELGPGPLDGMSDLAAALRESLRRHQREARTRRGGRRSRDRCRGARHRRNEIRAGDVRRRPTRGRDRRSADVGDRGGPRTGDHLRPSARRRRRRGAPRPVGRHHRPIHGPRSCRLDR